MSYGSEFYDTINPGSLRSARTVVPMAMALFGPATVADLGCGEGVWLSVFREHGCQVHGFDNGVDPARLQVPEQDFTPCDFTDGEINFTNRFDLAISLEVGEHLPEHRAAWFVRVLTAASDIVLFSAAVPGQGGTGHRNEQWPAYWAALFEGHDYVVSGALRWRLWGQAPGQVENWYAQNMLVCVQATELKRRWAALGPLFDSPLAEPFPVVHPVLWASRQ